jgi:hypothetical protein
MLLDADDGNIRSGMGMGLARDRTARDPAQFETRVIAQYVGDGLSRLAMTYQADAQYFRHDVAPALRISGRL